MLGRVYCLLPGLCLAWQAQVRRRKPREPCLGFRPTSHGTLIADLATRPCRGTRKGRDGRRVIVGFDLHQQMDRLFVVAIRLVFGVDQEPLNARTLRNRRVIGIRTQYAPTIGRRVGVTNHLKQRAGLFLAVD